MSEFQYLDQYRYLSSGCLNLTDNCNLACRYCFVTQHPNYMSLQTAKDAVDFLVSNLRYKKAHNYVAQNQKVDLTYFGGEPTLCWDSIIVPLTEYIETTYPDEVATNMTTNGTLLTVEKIDFLYEHNIPILLSIDGAKETQDYNRPYKNANKSSFDTLIEIIPYLLEKFPNTTFRSTIYADTVEHTFENYLFASYMGFHQIFMTPDERHPWTKQQEIQLAEELKKIFIFGINTFANGDRPIEASFINTMFQQILRADLNTYNHIDITEFQRDCYRCGLGTHYGSIGYDGSIYGCQEHPSQGENDKFFIGNIYQGGIDINKHQILLQDYNQIHKNECIDTQLCKHCKMHSVCDIQICPSTAQDNFNSFFIASRIFCYWQQLLFDNCLIAMYYLTETNNQIFKDYLDYNCNFNAYFNEVK